MTALAALTLCLAGAALADDLQTVGDPDSLGFSARRLARMTSWFEAQSEKGDPSGFVVGIAQGGKLAYLQATGFEDHDKKMPMRPDSIFRIGSMSKQITSVATMMLVDEGKLELDAPVAQYLPELRDMQVVKTDPATGRCDPHLELEPAKRAMTIRDLLRNTSGLVYASPDYADPGFGNTAIHVLYGIKAPFRRDKPIADFVASLGTLPLLHQPGEVWEYSIGYDVLGRVIEVVSGQPFDRFLQSRLFAPLHMVDSGFSVPQDKLDRLVAVPGAQPPPLSEWGRRQAANVLFGRRRHRLDGSRFPALLPDAAQRRRARWRAHLEAGNGPADDDEFDAARHAHRGTRSRSSLSVRAGGSASPVRTNPDFSLIPGAVGSFNWQGSWGTFFSVDPVQKLILVMMMQRTGAQ